MDVDSLQPYLGIATSVLSKQDVEATQTLKAFLVSMPSTKQIEQTLGWAVLRLATQDPSAFEWVVSNQSLLAPELDLKAFVKKIAVDRLCAHGWILGKDFDLDAQPPFLSGGDVTAILEQHFSPEERLLLRALFPLTNC